MKKERRKNRAAVALGRRGGLKKAARRRAWAGLLDAAQETTKEHPHGCACAMCAAIETVLVALGEDE